MKVIWKYTEHDMPRSIENYLKYRTVCISKCSHLFSTAKVKKKEWIK